MEQLIPAASRSNKPKSKKRRSPDDCDRVPCYRECSWGTLLFSLGPTIKRPRKQPEPPKGPRDIPADYPSRLSAVIWEEYFEQFEGSNRLSNSDDTFVLVAVFLLNSRIRYLSGAGRILMTKSRTTCCDQRAGISRIIPRVLFRVLAPDGVAKASKDSRISRQPFR